jgi:CheY-like chemotaxis protein
MRNSDILFVEDDDDDVFMLKHVCKKIGIERSTFVQNGRLAIEYLTSVFGKNADEYPIIFLDINMPEMDGFAFLRWLRGEAALYSIPVIILSTSENPRDMTTAYKLGANAYLVKTSAIGDLAIMLAAAHQFWSGFNRLPPR